MQTTENKSERTTIPVEYRRKYRTQPEKDEKTGAVIKPSKLMFVYAVKGDEKQLAKYKEVKGDFHRLDKDTKEPLFFTQTYADTKAEIVLNKEGKDWNIHNEELEILANLTAQHGIEVAKEMVSRMPK